MLAGRLPPNLWLGASIPDAGCAAASVFWWLITAIDECALCGWCRESLAKAMADLVWRRWHLWMPQTFLGASLWSFPFSQPFIPSSQNLASVLPDGSSGDIFNVISLHGGVTLEAILRKYIGCDLLQHEDTR